MNNPFDAATPALIECFEANQRAYAAGKLKPNYPPPAIPTRVEYVFGYGLADGIFVRVEDYIICGSYRDGMVVEGYPSIPYAYDYPDLD